MSEPRRRLRGCPAQHFRFDSIVVGLVWLADGALVTGLGDGSVRIGDAGLAQPVVARPHAPQAALLVLSPDIDGAGILTGGDDGALMRTDSTGRSTKLAELSGAQVDVLAINVAAGLRAAAGGREICLLNREGKVVATTKDHPSSVAGLAFNPKGRRLAVAHYGGITLWWTRSLGGTPTRLEWQGSHIGVTWSPDGRVIMSAMQGAELHGWRIADGEDIRMAGYALKVRSMVWLRKPMMLLTSGAGCVVGWNFAGAGPTGQPPVEIGGGYGQVVTVVATHPHKPFVAAGFDDGRAILCEIATDRVVRLRPGDDERVTAIAWSPDGRRLAVGTEQGSLSLFDPPLGAD